MYLENTSPDEPKKVLWREDTCDWFTGGFELDKTNLPATLTDLPKGTVLSIDFANRKAKVVKTARVTKAVLATDTEVQIAKGHILVATDVIGINSNTVTVGTINTSNANYDVITITANALGAVSLGAILESASGENIGLNYAPKPLKGTVSVSATLQAYEIQGANLPYPVSSSLKTKMTSRHQFIN